MTIDERRVLATQNTPWDSQVAELKRRLDLQQTDAEIAVALGRTERAVAIKRHKLGLGLIAYNLPVSRGRRRRSSLSWSCAGTRSPRTCSDRAGELHRHVTFPLLFSKVPPQ
jgi:hypothetical protein